MGFPLIDNMTKSAINFAYLDSAATSQIESSVLDAVMAFEVSSRANVHRGLYNLAEQASEAYEAARETVGAFFGGTAQNIVFTHGATEALNLVAFGWGAYNLRKGDLVLVDTANHHSNIIPWQMLAQMHGLELAFIDINKDAILDEMSWENLLENKPKVVALGHVSNVTGLSCDVKRLVEQAHRAGALVVLDCAQSAGHMPLDLVALDVDFAAISAHKMHGPFGIGALWAKANLWEQIHPIMGGGGMIGTVSKEGFTLACVPERFEAGTPNIAGAVGFAAACNYLTSVGLDKINHKTMTLVNRMLDVLEPINEIRVLGPAKRDIRSSLLAFVICGIHPHDIAEYLAEEGVCVRAGHHCAQPLHRALGLPASVRISFSVHSELTEVSQLGNALLKLRRGF